MAPFILCRTAAYGAGVEDVLSYSHGSSGEWVLVGHLGRGQPRHEWVPPGHQRGLGLVTFGCPGERQGLGPLY